MKFKGRKLTLPGAVLLIVILVISWFIHKQNQPVYSESVRDVPAFSGEPYVVINDNQPEFAQEDMTTDSYEYYSSLDLLGRCGHTMACIGYDLMPTEDRESISEVKPTGWVQEQYDFVDGKSLYNRCHLIGFQLTGENANERNLVTGTRYCNVQGMLPFENLVADYVKETRNHVLYRVTPIFTGEELVCRGIQMEAWSVEDAGDGVCFNVYVYNAQPGVVIDYATGESREEGEVETPVQTQLSGDEQTYILNTSSKKFHTEDCSQGQGIKDSNRETYTGSRETLIEQGYEGAGCCNP